VTESGEYTAELENSCGTFQYTANITQEDCDCKIFIPNSFTANADNLNDAFLIEYDCDFVDYELTIFNRWGKVVFNSLNPSTGWIGNDDNGDYYAPSEVYSYVLKYSSRDIGGVVISKILNGHINLVR